MDYSGWARFVSYLVFTLLIVAAEKNSAAAVQHSLVHTFCHHLIYSQISPESLTLYLIRRLSEWGH